MGRERQLVAFGSRYNRAISIALCVALALPLLVYASIGSYARYTADDFCWAGILRTDGFLNAQALWYVDYSPRYAFTLVVNLTELVGPSIVPFLPASAIVAWVVTLWWTLRQFGIARLPAFLLAEVGVLAALYTAPDLPQSLYWQTGMLTYVLPLILATWVVGWIRRGRCDWWALGLAFGVTFFAGGLSETYLIPQNVALTLAVAVSLVLSRSGALRGPAWFATPTAPAKLSAPAGSSALASSTALAPADATVPTSASAPTNATPAAHQAASASATVPKNLTVATNQAPGVNQAATANQGRAPADSAAPASPAALASQAAAPNQAAPESEGARANQPTAPADATARANATTRANATAPANATARANLDARVLSPTTLLLAAALAGGVVALVVILVAPSTAIRVGGSPADLWLAMSAAIATAAYQALRLVRYFPLAIALCLAAPVVLGTRSPRIDKRIISLTTSVVAITLPFCYFPSFYAQNGNPPARSLIVPGAILVGYLLFLGFALQPIARHRRVPALAGAAALALVALVPLGVAITSLPRQADASRYATLFDAEERQIRASRDAGQADLTVPSLPPNFGENFVSSDRQNWFNVCVARYYGVRSIATPASS